MQFARTYSTYEYIHLGKMFTSIGSVRSMYYCTSICVLPALKTVIIETKCGGISPSSWTCVFDVPCAPLLTSASSSVLKNRKARMN